MKVWILTFDDCCEFDGVFTTKEKARKAFQDRISNLEEIRNLQAFCDEDDFEYYQFKNRYENVEAIIQERELDKVY